MPKYRKVLLKKDKLELVVHTTKITGYKEYAFYSYLHLYENGELLAHKPLFCKSSKAKISHEAALRSLGDDHEKTLAELISTSLNSMKAINEELARAGLTPSAQA